MQQLIEQFMAQWCDRRPYIIAHTSGSTGTPKEIKLLKADMVMSARATNARFNINGHSHLHLILSPAYIAGKMMIVRALEAGCDLTYEVPSNHNLLSTDYGDIDLLAIVPSQCSQLLDNPVARKRLRNVIIGGAAISHATEQALLSAPWASYATYGMTETCSHVALRRMGTDAYTAMPGIRFSTDHRGCLRINAPQFSFRQLQTNDIADLLSPQSFIWRGRYDNVINSGGIKIFPEQLEAKLQPYIHLPFFVGSTAHPVWGTAVELVVELPDSEQANASELERQLKEVCHAHLSSVECPKAIKFMPTLPRTANGKIRRNY